MEGCLEKLLFWRDLVIPSPDRIAVEMGYALGDYHKFYNTRDAWTWMCGAANQQFADAQRSLGDWLNPEKEELVLLREAIETNADKRASYMWYMLAAYNASATAEEEKLRLQKTMTSHQIAEAEQMAHDWKPGDCPSAEHRLGPPK
jgi:hypothetical protein